MKFSTLTVITTLLQTAVKVKASGQDANATADGGLPAVAPADVTTIEYVFPIVPGVSSALQVTMDAMVAAFNELHPEIHVNSIYAGSYQQTYDYVVSRVDAGDPPAVAVVNVNRMVELNSMGAIIPLNDYIKEEGGQEFLDDYYAKMFKSEVTATFSFSSNGTDYVLGLGNHGVAYDEE